MQKFGICISLTYNDLLEISAVWRTFYYFCRQNMRFVENLSHSRALISGVNIFYQYKNIWLLFAEQLFYLLNVYFEEDVLFTSKNLLLLNLFSKFFLFVFSIIYFAAPEAITVPIDFFRRQLGKVSCWCTKFFLFILTVLSLKKRFIQVVVIILVFFITNT